MEEIFSFFLSFFNPLFICTKKIVFFGFIHSMVTILMYNGFNYNDAEKQTVNTILLFLRKEAYMMQRKSVFLKLLALTLLLVLTFTLLTGCKSRAIPAGKLAQTPVGQVDGRDILYEELYFLVSGYLPALQAKYGDDVSAIRAELSELVAKNITANSAILRLCENEGLVYDEKALKEDAQQYVDSLIASDFGGDRKAYREGLAEGGMTDHYLRFTASVDALYGQLPTVYLQNGLAPQSDEAIRSYVQEHFIRTWHIAILVEEGETYEDNLKKAKTALAKIEGGTSMYEMIGSTYNEDFSLVTTDGYYFPRGTMDKTYEEAAFALEIGQNSAVVESTGISNKTGDRVTCFYIIERLALDTEYIDSHLSALSDQCANAVVAQKLDAVSATLSFVPNDYYATLDLTALEAPKDGIDVPLVLLILGISLVVLAGITVSTIMLIRKRKKKKSLSVKSA